MPQLGPEGLTLLQLAQIAATMTAVVGGLAAVISYFVYRGHAKQLRLTANEHLMQMVINMNKVCIEHPELSFLTRPEEAPAPKSGDMLQEAKMRAYMYMHLNMFDVAFNYYYNTLGLRSEFIKKHVRNAEEVDHWKGWSRWMEVFVNIPYVEYHYGKEAHQWYDRQFKAYLHTLNNRLPPS